MLVILEIPPIRGTFARLAALLPAGEAGWLGEGDVANCRLVGTDLPMAQARLLLPEATLWTFNMVDPMAGFVQRWGAAADDPSDPLHAMANTFSVTEAVALDLPEAAAGALVRRLSTDGNAGSVDAVIAHLDTLPVLVGYVQHPAAYGAALDRLLGLKPRTVDGMTLAPRNIKLAKPVREALEERFAPDVALARTLYERRSGALVYLTPPALAVLPVG